MATQYGLLYNQDKKQKKQEYGTALNTGAKKASSPGVYGLPQVPNIEPGKAFKMPTGVMTPEQFSSSMQGPISPPATPSIGINSSSADNVMPTPVVDGVSNSSGGSSSGEAPTSDWGKMQASEGMQKANSVVGATAGTAAGLASMGAAKIGEDASLDYGDIDKEIDAGKMQGAGALSGAGKGLAMGASIGSVIPGVGTAIGAAAGAVIGGIAGYFSGKKKAKKAEEERQKLIKKRTHSRMRAKKAKMTAESNQIMDSASARYSQIEQLRGGGKFRLSIYNYDDSPKEGPLKKIERKKVEFFKRGGKLSATANIIPNGVSHEEKNDLGTKGMPVIKCKNNSCEKLYEIESDELIITLDTTSKIEALHKEKDTDKLGDYVLAQLLDNTHSFTKRYEYLN